jgi:dolichyl-phosphate beta-glucosyltransferase
VHSVSARDRRSAPTSQPACALSIIIPAYNEADRLPTSLAALRDYCAARPDVEVILVDDGSTDGTAEVAQEWLAGMRGRVVRLPRNQGKGGALRAGVLAAAGATVMLMDADLSGCLLDIDDMVGDLDRADIVIGSRMAAGSHVTYGSDTRRNCSRAFNVIACAMTGIAASDTQCGFKALRTPVARRLFAAAHTRGFAIDVELLLLADLFGYVVNERAITWREVEGSRVRLVRDSVLMLRDIRRAHRQVMALRSALPAHGLPVAVTGAQVEPMLDLRVPTQGTGAHDQDPAGDTDLESVQAG